LKINTWSLWSCVFQQFWLCRVSKQGEVAPEDELIVKARAFLRALEKGDFTAAGQGLRRNHDESVGPTSWPNSGSRFRRNWVLQKARRRPAGISSAGYEGGARNMRVRESHAPMPASSSTRKEDRRLPVHSLTSSAEYEPRPTPTRPKFEEARGHGRCGGDWPLAATLAIPKGAGLFRRWFLSTVPGPATGMKPSGRTSLSWTSPGDKKEKGKKKKGKRGGKEKRGKKGGERKKKEKCLSRDCRSPL